jgi:hypothetical protein
MKVNKYNYRIFVNGMTATLIYKTPKAVQIKLENLAELYDEEVKNDLAERARKAAANDNKITCELWIPEQLIEEVKAEDRTMNKFCEEYHVKTWFWKKACVPKMELKLK